MSGGNSANNSWTILTPEETVAETLRPLAEGTEHHEKSLTSAADSGANQPAEGEASAEGSPVEQEHLVSEEKTAELSGETSTEQHTSVPTGVTDATVPTSLEVSSSFVPGSVALSQSEGLPKGPAQSSPDPDSFSDSYSHITPSPDEPPASFLGTETLVFTQEEERLAHEGTLHPLKKEELQQEGEESDQSPRTSDLGKQAEVGEEKTERTEDEGEPEVRRRRSLLASLEQIGRAEEEEEGEEEFQLPQREEDSGFSVNKCILGAVILLGLGTIFFSEGDYGTRDLKDSELPGKQEWLNPEVPPPPVDADNTELLNKLSKGNQQISVLQAQLQAQKEELKVAKGQAAEGAKERLRWEEVEKENSRLKTEIASLPVLQTENEKMKRELESVPTLQKELETLRSTVTELKRSTAASEASEVHVKATTSPPSGQPEDSRQEATGPGERQASKIWTDQKKTDRKKEKHDIGEKKGWKHKEKTEFKEGEKKEHKDEGKRGKQEQGKFDKEKGKEDKHKRHSDETKQWKEKEWKKDKGSRGDEGKPWKAREGKKEWMEKSERKDWKGEKDWKKAKHEKVNDSKQWRGKEEKQDWKRVKDHGEKLKVKDEWKGEKEWKKVKDGFKGSGHEKKDWEQKGERKDWKKGGEWRVKNDEGNDWKGKGERKRWDESENRSKNRGKDERKQWNENEWKSKDDKEWKRKDERKQWDEKEWKSKNGKDERKQRDEKEWKSKNGKDERKQQEKKGEDWKKGQKRDNGDWKKDSSTSPKHKDEHKLSGKRHHDHSEKHEWGDGKVPHTHRRPSLEQPEYWVQQRNRLQHNPKPPQHCNSLETCAQAEGLRPVPWPEFDAILQTYLAKAEEVGVDASKREELKKLATEFFKEGLFVHDRMSFQDFVEDVGDILEDMVEGEETEEEEEEDDDDSDSDSDIEQEMEEFEKEVMKKFSVPGLGENEERIKGEWRKGSGRGRG